MYVCEDIVKHRAWCCVSTHGGGKGGGMTPLKDDTDLRPPPFPIFSLAHFLKAAAALSYSCTISKCGTEKYWYGMVVEGSVHLVFYKKLLL